MSDGVRNWVFIFIIILFSNTILPDDVVRYTYRKTSFKLDANFNVNLILGMNIVGFYFPLDKQHLSKLVCYLSL
jgi:hypothetical protein